MTKIVSFTEEEKRAANQLLIDPDGWKWAEHKRNIDLESLLADLNDILKWACTDGRNDPQVVLLRSRLRDLLHI